MDERINKQSTSNEGVDSLRLVGFAGIFEEVESSDFGFIFCSQSQNPANQSVKNFG